MKNRDIQFAIRVDVMEQRADKLKLRRPHRIVFQNFELSLEISNKIKEARRVRSCNTDKSAHYRHKIE